ncbi:MAG: energy transducer TonB [Terracidiphilus sp.]
MGHIVFKASKTPVGGNQFARGSGEMNQAGIYNRSSLALEFAPETALEEPHIPHLVSMPNTARTGVPDSPLWRGQDPFTSQAGRGSRNVSMIIHIVVISGIVWWSLSPYNRIIQPKKAEMVFKLFTPQTPPIKPVPKPIQGGGGGGEHRIIQPRRANPPKQLVHLQKMLPPEIARVQKPILPLPPSLHANLPQNYSLPRIGMPKSPQIAVDSQGSGSNGFGIGMGGGMGQGRGDGADAGAGGGYGGGVMNVGGGVSAPEVLHSVDPQFTSQARAADLQGTVSIQLIVDSHGNPQDVHVVRHLGMGLDQKAVEAVRQYRFRPAMYRGHAVAVQMIVDVAFHLH